jgi:putative hydrolase of HD superfamily
MTRPAIADIQKLVHEIVVPFYLIDRDMDIQTTDTTHRKETDAEHAWSIALVACTIAPLIDKTLDVGKIAQLAIVHDLVEIHAGDVSIWGTESDLSQKEAKEEASFKKIAKDFAHFPWLVDHIEEYESKSSPEARFVYAVDKLVPFFFRVLVKPKPFERKKITMDMFKEGIAKSRIKAQSHPIIGEYFDEMLEVFFDHPEYFYVEE